MNYCQSLARQAVSDFVGECLNLDLRPSFGLTSPPSAAVLVPKTDNILMPSALMF